VQRPNLTVRDSLCVPERALCRHVDRVRDDEHLVPGHACRSNRGCARTQAPGDLAVMPADAEEREHEQWDRDDHHPRSRGELRPDQDEGDDERG
jgi:hypothetical protein